MKKVLIIAFILLIKICSAHNVYVESILEDELDKNNEVDVIVVLDDDVRNFEISPLSKDFKLKHRYSTINSFSGKITKTGLNLLKQDPRIKRIEFDRPVHIFLDSSVPLINATNVWIRQTNGVNITGLGAVCVIDTGVDYTHSALGNCTNTSFLAGNCSKVITGYNYCEDDACTQESNDPMDNNGHGTHVAGIVASTHSAYRGVAPDAKIVAIKALNSTGGGPLSAIIAGIEWCTNNASIYNISVISMSFGTAELYPTYCDSNFSLLTDAINNAIAKNISVFASTGNDGSTIGIASPACIENVTAVGGVNDADSILYNRNNITDLLAPGYDVTSTYLTNTFTSLSGTSMATPHAAGSALLLMQYKKNEEGESLTPSQIKNALKSAGKMIYDSGSGLNFSRINVLATLISIDEKNPSLVLYEPMNKTYSSKNLSLNYSSYDVNLNDTFYNIDNGDNITLTGNTTFSVSEGFHVLNIYNNDENGNENATSVSFSVDTTPLSISFVSPTPNNETKNTANIFINVTTSESPDQIWLEWNGANETMNGSGTIWSKEKNNLINGNYSFRVYANDSAGNMNASETRWVYVDVVLNLVILLPENTTYNYNTSLSLNYTVNTTLLDACWYNLDGENNISLGSGGNCINTTFNTSEGSHYLYLFVNDTSGNMNDAVRGFSIDMTAPHINIQSPTNTTYNNLNISLNFTVSEMPDWCGYELNGNNNVSTCTNTTFIASEGFNILKLWVNDTIGNMNVSSVAFSVDTTPLSISFVSPTPNNETRVNNNSIFVNVTTGEVPDWIWLEWNGANETMNGSGMLWYKIKTVTSVGNYSFRVYANDSAGNMNASETRWVYVDDTLNPHLIVSMPENRSYSSSTLSLSYTVSDNIGIDSCWYKLNEGNNITLANCSNTTMTAVSGANTITIAVNDTAGNMNKTTIFFSYSSPPPVIIGGGSISIPKKSEIMKTWSQVIEGEVKKMDVEKKDIPVKSITFKANKNLSNVKVVVKMKESDDIKNTIELNVYQYFSIIAKNMEDKDVEKVEITFTVNKTWIIDNNYDKNTVTLNRYHNNTWNALSTYRIKENQTIIMYKSVSPGFSLFAITVKEITVEKHETEKEEPEKKTCPGLITVAIKDGECIEYPTPCDVPENWTIVDRCPSMEIHKEEAEKEQEWLKIMIYMIVLIVVFLLFEKEIKKEIRQCS